MKRYIWLILLVIFFFAKNAFTEHQERGVIRQRQDVCEYEIYFKDGYIGNMDAHIRVILKAPLRAVHPVLEIKFTSTKGDSVHTICDLTERNRCLKEVWSGGVPYGPRGELRSFGGEHIVYPESLGELGHFGDKRESIYRNQDWERGFIEIIYSGERVLARVPYFVRLLADRGFIAFGQAALREQRLYEQTAQLPSLQPSLPIPPPPPPSTTPPTPSESDAEIDYSELEFNYDFMYEYSINSSVYPPVLNLIIKAREKVPYRSIWQPYGKDYLVFNDVDVYGDAGYRDKESKRILDTYVQECVRVSVGTEIERWKKCSIVSHPSITIRRLRIEKEYSIFSTKMLLESPITRYLVEKRGFKYSIIEPEPGKFTEKIKVDAFTIFRPKELGDWRDKVCAKPDSRLCQEFYSDQIYWKAKRMNEFQGKINYFLYR